MRVLHLAAGNLFGGIETYLLTLARLRHLCPEMEPHFGLCFPGRLRDELIAAGVPVHDLGAVRLSRPWTVLRARWRLTEILQAHGFAAAVTHGTWPHAAFAPAARRAGGRLVNFIHDGLKSGHWINRWASRTAPDRLIANSCFTAASAANVFPGVPVQVCYLPVAAPEVGDREGVRREVRAGLETPDDAVVILQSSRLERWKGQSVHLDALAKLRDLSGWVAWFAGGPQKAGEGEFLAELKAAAEQTGIADRVRFLGQRSDVPRLMAAADAYCQPNLGPEPFGIALVEALLAGRPVVSSDFGGAREIVTNDCGVLCPPGDGAAVANALRDLITDPELRQLMGSAGPARARQLCEPRHQLAELFSAIQNLSRVWV